MELSPDAYADLNDGLLNQFKAINLQGVNYISLFLPILERREPNTFFFIDWIKQNHPQIKLAFPKADFTDNSMLHFLEDSELEIDTNDYGIPEPISGNEIKTTEIDMVLVPLLAFDKRGYRVGYGKGFYDRFMVSCKPGTQFVGLSFFEPVAAIEDIDEHDMLLHQCITPQTIWQFNS
jgi:5-formyltetrahydrofolate cyclo-ligase